MPGVYQVEYFYLIPVLAEQLGGIVIELRLRIRNDCRLSAFEYGEQRRTDHTTGFSGTGCTEYGDVAVQSGVFR